MERLPLGRGIPGGLTLGTLPVALLATALMIVVGVASGCDPGIPEGNLEITIPRPDLSGFEPLLGRRLEGVQRRAQDRLDAWREAGSEFPSDPATALAEALGTLGNHYHALLFLEAAEDCYAEAARLDPEAFPWPYFLGVTRGHQGQDDDAVEAFEAAARLDPDHLPSRVRLGDLYLKLGRLEDAREQYGRAVTLDPDSAVSHFGLGRAAAMAGDPEAAVEHFRRTLELAPQASAVHYPLARALQRLGRTREAEREMEQHGEVGLGFPDPLMQRVLRLEAESAVDSIRSLAAQPDRLADDELVDFAAAQLANLEGALEVFRDRVEGGAAEGDPVSARARTHFALGVLLSRRQDRAGAARHLEEALALDPDFEGAHVPLADALLAEGRAAAARRRLERALTTELSAAQEVDVRARLGDLALRAGDLAEAARQWDRALALDADALGPRLGRATLLGRTGRYRQAADEYERVLAGHPDHLQARLGLATALALDGRPADAARALEEGLAALEGLPGEEAEERRTVLRNTLRQLASRSP